MTSLLPQGFFHNVRFKNPNGPAVTRTLGRVHNGGGQPKTHGQLPKARHGQKCGNQRDHTARGQKGDSAPAIAANTIIFRGDPLKDARESNPSAPLGLAIRLPTRGQQKKRENVCKTKLDSELETVGWPVAGIIASKNRQ